PGRAVVAVVAFGADETVVVVVATGTGRVVVESRGAASGTVVIDVAGGRAGAAADVPEPVRAGAATPAKRAAPARARAPMAATCDEIPMGRPRRKGSWPTHASGPATQRTLTSDTLRMARTTLGSNWVPAHLVSSSRAAF